MSNRFKDKENRIINKITKNILKYNLIEDKDTVLIGLSAGPDSVFLTLMLYKQIEILKKHNISFNIEAAHINHKIRDDATNDANIARSLCERLNIPIYIEEVNVVELAKKQKIGIEECGRNVRYDLFYNLCKKHKKYKIAVAHNMEDNAETIIMNLLRGAATKGLKAMEYINQNVIRPLLNISKSDIVQYLDYNNIEYAIDKTNFENNYTRNKIRNTLLNELKKYNPNIIQTLNNMSEILKDEEKIINEVIDKKTKNIIEKKSNNEILIKINIYNELKDYEKKLFIKKLLDKAIDDQKGTTYDHIISIEKLLNEHKKTKRFEIKDKYVIEIANKDYAILKILIK